MNFLAEEVVKDVVSGVGIRVIRAEFVCDSGVALLVVTKDLRLLIADRTLL